MWVGDCYQFIKMIIHEWFSDYHPAIKEPFCDNFLNITQFWPSRSFLFALKSINEQDQITLS